MRAKNVIMAMVCIALLGFTNLQIRADIPIIKADTVFQGFAGGSVTGIVFTSDPDKVILMHVATPKVIDIKTHQVVREFEAVPNFESGGDHTFIVKEKDYLVSCFNSSEILGIKDFSGDVVWNIKTGMIIKAIPDILLLSDGNTDRYYTYWNYNFCSYDFETFKFKDSFNLNSIKSTNCEWSGYGIIPNTNKVLMGLDNYFTYKDQSGNWKKEYRLSELYLLDFDTKEFTKIPIPYETWQTSSEIMKIAVTETGKYNIVSIKFSGSSEVFFFYDKSFNFLHKESSEYFRQILNSNYLYYCDLDITINDDYLLFAIIDRNKPLEGSVFYDIATQQGTKLLNHFPTTAFNNITQKIAMVDENGRTGFFELYVLPVEENSNINSVQSIQYINSSLLINTILTGQVNIEIIDNNGNMLQSLNDVYLHNGTNTVKMNVPLANGVYFCVIKSANDSNSFKFIVIQ